MDKFNIWLLMLQTISNWWYFLTEKIKGRVNFYNILKKQKGSSSYLRLWENDKSHHQEWWWQQERKSQHLSMEVLPCPGTLLRFSAILHPPSSTGDWVWLILFWKWITQLEVNYSRQESNLGTFNSKSHNLFIFLPH